MSIIIFLTFSLPKKFLIWFSFIKDILKKFFFLKILDDFFMSEKKLTFPLVLIIILQLGIGLKGLSLPLIFKSHATFSGADIKYDLIYLF